MKFKTFFSNPKVMALSGIIAMLLKIIIAGCISIIINLYMNIHHLFSCALILFPIVALISDLILYLFKNIIWTKLPDLIPEDWQITPAQLLEYAKNLPKVRLMRFSTCWIFMVFFSGGRGWFFLIDLMATITLGFLFCSFLDAVWLKIFKLTIPEFPLKSMDTTKTHQFMNSAEYARRIARDSDVSYPGSTAWFSQQYFNSRR